MDSQKQEIIQQAQIVITRKFEELRAGNHINNDKALKQLQHNINFCFISIEKNISTLRFLYMILPKEIQKAEEQFDFSFELPVEFMSLIKPR